MPYYLFFSRYFIYSLSSNISEYIIKAIENVVKKTFMYMLCDNNSKNKKTKEVIHVIKTLIIFDDLLFSINFKLLILCFIDIENRIYFVKRNPNSFMFIV